jgi:twitching motility protein PilT
MVGSARIRECIVDSTKTRHIREAISAGHTTYGMQTFDQSLMQLLKNKLITYEEAVRHSSNPDDFALKIKGVSSSSDLSWDEFDKGEKEESGDIDIERF